MSKYCIVLTTFPDEEDANDVITEVLKNRLAACMQTIPIDSHYIWEDKVCHDKEVLVLFKTSWESYDALEGKLKELHPYDTPEIIAVDIEKGYKGYLNWIDEVTGKRDRLQ